MKEPVLIRAEATNPATVLRLCDHHWTECASGVGSLEYEGVSGIYRLEGRLPGVSKTDTVVALSGKVQHRLESPLGRSPLFDLATIENGEADALLRLRERLYQSKESRRGYLLLATLKHLSSGKPADVVLRRRDGQRPARPEFQEEGPSVRLRAFLLEPGTWQLEHTSVHGQRRAQAVFVEAGWVTEMYGSEEGLGLAADAASLSLAPCGEAPSWVELRQTASTIYFFESTSRYFADRKVRPNLLCVLAENYGRIRKVSGSTDALVATAGQLGSKAESKLAPRDEERKELESILQSARMWTEKAPNCPDLRLQTMLCLWEQAAGNLVEEVSLDAKRISEHLDLLNKIDRMKATWQGISALILGITTVALPLKASDWGETSPVPPEFLPYAGILASVAGAGITSILGLLSARNFLTRRARARLLDEPPLFAEGTRLLLRMAALYEGLVHQNSRLANVALRHTVNSVWTRWSIEESSRDARQRFRKSFARLEQTLSSMEPCRMEGKAPIGPRDAAAYLASTLALPLSVVLSRIRTLSQGSLDKLPCFSPETLVTSFRKDVATPPPIKPDFKEESLVKRPKWIPILLLSAVTAVVGIALLMPTPTPQNSSTTGSIIGSTTGDVPTGGRDMPVAQGFSAEGDTIKIGLVAPLTGGLKAFGQDSVDGARLAVDEFNRSGGYNGKKVELVYEDSQSTPEGAKTAAERLLSEGPIGIIGEVSSGNTIQVGQTAYEIGVPVVSVGATRDDVTEIGANVFRVGFTDSFQARVMAKFAYQGLRLRKMAVITDREQSYSGGLSNEFIREFKRLGGNVVAEGRYEGSQSAEKYGEMLSELNGRDSDGLFLSGFAAEVGPIVRQARKMGIQVPVLGGDGWDDPVILKSGRAIRGGYFCTQFENNDTRPETINFLNRWRREFKRDPDNSIAALSYSATALILDALKRSREASSRALINSLENTVDFRTAVGGVTLKNNDGNPNPQAVIVRITDSDDRGSWKTFVRSYTSSEIDP